MSSFKRIPLGEASLDSLNAAIDAVHECMHVMGEEAATERKLAETREELRLVRHELLMNGQEDILKRVSRIEESLGIVSKTAPNGQEKVRRIIAGMSPWKVFTGLGGAIFGYSLLGHWIEPGVIEIAKGVWNALVATHKAWIASGAPTGG